MQGEVLYWLGEPAQAQEHCEQGIALYDPQQHRSHMFIYGNDTGVGCRMSGALALWQLGYPDQALRTAHEMLILAHKLSHPFTLVCALYHSAVVHQLRREAPAAQQRVEALLQISTEHGFALYSAWGATLRGWTLAQQGREEEGIDWIRRSIAVWQATGGVLGLPQQLAFVAEAYGKAGKTQEALSLLDEALRLVDRNGERCWEAELYRLKAELLVKGEEEIQAEACFQHALAVARRQDTRSWELRAAMGLCRLWQEQGKLDDAWEMLAEIYGWFTEGFDTTDLREARALLEAPA